MRARVHHLCCSACDPNAVQISSVILYGHHGEVRELPFHPGFNVITGDSATGKSALLDIIEYCLGRGTLEVPVGRIVETVAWYAVILQLPTTQVFIGRPAAQPGRASTSVAMLEIAESVTAPSFTDLRVNADTSTIRESVGRMLGIEENASVPSSALRTPLEANLAHAALLCFQRQSEIANRSQLFHRQGDDGIAGAIQETLPYFLGAYAKDHAVLRQQLLAARRELRLAEQELHSAETANEDMEVTLRSLVAQAQASGLTEAEMPNGTEAGVALLREIVASPPPEVPLDDEAAVRRSALVRQREDLRRDLRAAGEERALLESLGNDEVGFESVVAQQIGRLRSLDLLGDASTPTSACPACNSLLADADPTADELRETAERLSAKVGTIDANRPRRQQAIADVERRIGELRQKLRSVEEAIEALIVVENNVDIARRSIDAQVFLQGRIQQYLDTARQAESQAIERARQRVATRAAAVEALESQLDPDEEREQLFSRLNSVGQLIGRFAAELQLEHSSGQIRLDLRRLTVVVDTAQGSAPLVRIGSGKNWIGYHLAVHLALHMYFRTHARPVPAFLMLDQPTQAYYPPDVTHWSGEPETSSDSEAVTRIFELLRDFAAELNPTMQVIVCDHANLNEPWFQDAIIENWRGGAGLIPESWRPADN